MPKKNLTLSIYAQKKKGSPIVTFIWVLCCLIKLLSHPKLKTVDPELVCLHITRKSRILGEKKTKN